MKALTIRQPWASAIALGPKRVENRTWVPKSEPDGFRFAIHAGASLDRGARLPDGVDLPLDDLPLGAVIGFARYRGASRPGSSPDFVFSVPSDGDDPWSVGPWCWQLDQVVPIWPLRIRGRQGLWVLPPEHEAEAKRRARLVWRAELELGNYETAQAGLVDVERRDLMAREGWCCGSLGQAVFRSGPHVGLWCHRCGEWLTWIPHRLLRRELDSYPVRDDPSDHSPSLFSE